MKKFAMKSIWMNALAWAAAVAAALSLAIAAPSESSVMGKLPFLTAKRANQQAVALPADLPAQRTLAVITFNRGQRSDAETWIQGLELRSNADVQWVRMPVLNDPGNEAGRAAMETRLLSSYPSNADRATLLPVFTDREAFLRTAALANHDQVYVLVLNRQGDILARAEGPYDADKAQALRETLNSHDL